MKGFKALLLALLICPAAFGQVKISGLPAAGTLTGSEQVPMVQSGQTVISTVSNIRGTSANTISQWLGTCNGTTFLRGDGNCATPTAAGLNLPNLVLTGAPSTANSWMYGSVSTTGTGAFYGGGVPNRAAYNWFQITSDTVAWPNTATGGTGLAGGFEFFDNLKNGWDGFRFGYECYIKQDAAPQTIVYQGAQVSTNILCYKGQIQINSNMGGIPGAYGGANGNIFDINPNISAGINATWLALMEGSEVDINATTFNGAPAEKMGYNFVLSGNCTQPCSAEIPGAYTDVAVNFGTNDTSGTSYWDTFLNTGNYGHATASNYSTTYLNATRRQIGAAATAPMVWPNFRNGVHFMHADFARFASTSLGTVSAISVSNNLATATVASVTAAQVIGCVVEISGATPASWNGNYVVVITSSTTVAWTTNNSASYTANSGTATLVCPQGYAFDSPGAAVSPDGIVYGTTVQAGLNGFTSATAVVGSVTVDPQPYGGYVGGAYFNVSNPTFAFSTILNETNPTIGTINSFLTAALLMTDSSSYISSAANAPNGTQVSTGCVDGDTITITGGTFSTAAQVRLATDGAGHIKPFGATWVSGTTSAITTAGAYTVMPGATPGYTGGSCAAPLGTWLQLGFGISTVTLSGNGANYPASPPPEVYTKAPTAGINTHGRFIANMTATTNPIIFNKGNQSQASWGTGGIIVGGQGTQTLTDTTGSDAAAILAAWSIPVYNFACPNLLCAETNLTALYVQAPTQDGNFASATPWSIQTSGGVKVGGQFVATGGPINIGNNNGTNTQNYCTGTGTGACVFGETSGATTLNGSAIKINGQSWNNATAPTVTSGLGTSPTVSAPMGTLSFRVTTGASGTPSATVVLGMPSTGGNDWFCQVNDKTTNTVTGHQTAESATSVTFTMSVAPSLNDILFFQCGAVP